MKTTLMLAFGALALSLSSGLTGALIALHLNNSRQASEVIPIVRTSRLEVLGTKENVEAVLADEGSGVSLTLLSRKAQPLLTLSVVEGSPEMQTAASTMGALALQYPYPEIALKDTNQRPTITIAGYGEGGTITFASSDRYAKVLLGHFGTIDDSTPTGAWGLEVNGMMNGLHASTGVGINDYDHVDKNFLVPATKPMYPYFAHGLKVH